MHKVHGLWLPDRDDGHWIEKFGGLLDGKPAYQYSRIEACLERCGRRRTFVDGGAHVGLWSIRLTSLFERVVAFEPVTANFQCLLANTQASANIDLHHAALGDADCTVQMANDKGGKSFSWYVGKGEGQTTCTRLDALDLQDVDLIKLDVEGYELEALRGAEETIDRCRPVIMIEEKYSGGDATRFLQQRFGLHPVWSRKHDYLFMWN